MVFETIREFLCEQLACDESRVTPDTVMLEDLEMEPSDLGDLMLSLEQEFASNGRMTTCRGSARWAI